MINKALTLLEELWITFWILMASFLILWVHTEQKPLETNAPAGAPAGLAWIGALSEFQEIIFV